MDFISNLPYVPVQVLAGNVGSTRTVPVPAVRWSNFVIGKKSQCMYLDFSLRRYLTFFEFIFHFYLFPVDQLERSKNHRKTPLIQQNVSISPSSNLSCFGRGRMPQRVQRTWYVLITTHPTVPSPPQTTHRVI